MEERREILRKLNSAAWRGEEVFQCAPTLESSFKKNVAFVKKARSSMNAENCAHVLEAIKTLTLEKYLSELTPGVFEGLCGCSKNEDITAATEIISALHQRFKSAFTSSLLGLILHGLSNDQEETIRITRQKNLLRVISDLYLVGVFTSFEDALIRKRQGMPIYVILKDILTFEIDSGNSLETLVLFIKRYKKDLDKDGPFADLRDLIRKYVSTCMQHLTAQDKLVKNINVKNEDEFIRTGRVREEKLQKLNRAEVSRDVFYSPLVYLSEVTGVPFPDFDSDTNVHKDDLMHTPDGNANMPWGDEKMTKFYSSTRTAKELLAQDTNDDNDEKSQNQKISLFLKRLDSANTEEELEKLTIYFHKNNLDSKSSRTKIKQLFTETKTFERFKFYSKFLKINQEEPPFDDLITELISFLDSGMRSQIKGNSLSFKYNYFFSEMVKFKLVPTAVLFHKIHTLTMNVTLSNNMDILMILYEQIGMFLLAEPEYRGHMLKMVDRLKEKYKSLSPTCSESFRIRSILALFSPRKDMKEASSELSLEQQFILRLLKVDLNAESCSVVFRLLLKFVNAGKHCDFIISCFSQIEHFSYDAIPVISLLLSKFSENHRWIIVKTIDNVIETTKRGLELNDYRFNNVRVANAKYIAEIYNRRMIDITVFKSLIYMIVCFEYPNNQPLPSGIESDLPNNHFRLRLVSVMLDAMNDIDAVKKPGRKPSEKALLKHTIAKKKYQHDTDVLKEVLIFFQFYMHCKSKPIPSDIEIIIRRILDRHFNNLGLQHCTSLREAVVQLQELIKAKSKKSKEIQKKKELSEVDEEGDEVGEEDRRKEDKSENEQQFNGDKKIERGINENIENSGQGNLVEVSDEQANKTKHLENDFEKDFEMMVADSYEKRKNTPFTNEKLDRARIPNGSAPAVGPLSFSLLTRKGKKTELRAIKMPEQNAFASSILKEHERDKQHREKILELANEMDS